MNSKTQLFSRHFCVLAFGVLISFSNTSSAQYQVNRIESIACDEGAEQFAKAATAVGDGMSRLLNETAANSPARIETLKGFEKLEQDLTDKWYENSKKSIKINKEHNTMDPLLWEYYWKVKLSTISFAFLIAMESPGKSELTYRRMIEDKCKNIKN